MPIKQRRSPLGGHKESIPTDQPSLTRPSLPRSTQSSFCSSLPDMPDLYYRVDDDDHDEDEMPSLIPRAKANPMQQSPKQVPSPQPSREPPSTLLNKVPSDQHLDPSSRGHNHASTILGKSSHFVSPHNKTQTTAMNANTQPIQGKYHRTLSSSANTSTRLSATNRPRLLSFNPYPLTSNNTSRPPLASSKI